MRIVRQALVLGAVITALILSGCSDPSPSTSASGGVSVSVDGNGDAAGNRPADPEASKQACLDFKNLQEQMLAVPLPVGGDRAAWDAFNAPFFELADNAPQGDVGSAMRAYTDSIRKGGQDDPPYDYPYGSGSTEAHDTLKDVCSSYAVGIR